MVQARGADVEETRAMKRNSRVRYANPYWSLTNTKSWKLTIYLTAEAFVLVVPGTRPAHR